MSVKSDDSGDVEMKPQGKALVERDVVYP